MTPLATVVICTRDRPDQLAACLDALAHQTFANFEIIVVDNGSRESVGEICRAHGVTCIHEPEPGLTRARNRGAREARGEVVAYIDDDAVAEPAWLDALAREFADPRVAAVAGHTRYMLARGDTLEMTNVDAPDEGRVRERTVLDRATPGWFAVACFGGVGDGNTMAFRRAAITSALRFDERIGRGRLIDAGDEHVAFMSAVAGGYRVVHTPDAVVRHPAPATEPLRRAKRARDARSSIAYLLFLTDQFPRYRRDIVGFVARALVRRTRGLAGPAAGRTGLPFRDAVAAVTAGCRLYWRARREWRDSVLAR